jgi:hypothetical protein
MQPHSFFKDKLAAIALVLDEEEKNADLRDKKKRMWVHKISPPLSLSLSPTALHPGVTLGLLQEFPPSLPV